jgi:hypothetical protein
MLREPDGLGCGYDAYFIITADIPQQKSERNPWRFPVKLVKSSHWTKGRREAMNGEKNSH